MSAADAASLNWLSWWYTIGAWFVVIGVGLEGAEIYARRSAKRKLRRFIGPLQHPPTDPQTPSWAHAIGDIGFLILVGALVLEQVCHHRMEDMTGRERNRLTEELDSTTKQAAESNERSKQLEATNLVMRSNVASLETAVRQLAHLYDQSSNALAEANARLMTIRPLKERLIECLNEIDPLIIHKLRGGQTTFDLNPPVYKFNRLNVIAGERGSALYISVKVDPTLTLQLGVGQVQHCTIELKPELSR